MSKNQQGKKELDFHASKKGGKEAEQKLKNRPADSPK